MLDTSVVVKWFLNEPDSYLAERFLEAVETGAIHALAPTSLFYEVANVFWVRRRDGVTSELAAGFLAALKQVNLTLVGADELLPQAEALAFELSQKFYNATEVDGISVVMSRCGGLKTPRSLEI